MQRSLCLAFASLTALLAFVPAAPAQEPKTLMQRVVDWQYPDSKFSGASASDAATVNRKGERTIPSVQYKAVLTTADPIAAVVEYYKTKLQDRVAPDDANANQEPAIDSSRSVTYHEDSENRPIAIHMILINTAATSTTLVISRAQGETETHIAWAQYERL